MPKVHLTLRGEWVACHATVRACPRLFHLEDMTVKAARQLPSALVEPLFEALDPPAKVDAAGRRFWGKDGITHQANGVYSHREHDLPARIDPDGSRYWYQKGKIHRDGDKPAIVYADGSLEWWVNGSRHRENGKPAVITIGAVEWWERNAEHREGGPAYVSLEGARMVWYRRGQYTKQETVYERDNPWRVDAKRWLENPYRS